MNFQAIFRMLSFVISALVLVFAICGTVDVFIFENKENQDAWIYCIEITLLITFLLFALSLHRKPEIFRREALATVGLSWIAISIVGTLPYLLICHIPFCDALFESTSGITTTGMTLLSNPETLGNGLLLWRALSQWIGGLGIAVFFVFMTNSMGMTAKRIFSNESSCNMAEFNSGKFKNNALSLLGIYFLLTFSCLFVFLLLGMPPFDALCHTLSTVSTGGFSTHCESIAYFHSCSIELAITFFMALSGINFVILVDLVHHFYAKYSPKSIRYLIIRLYKKILENEEIRIYGGLIFLSGATTASILNFEKENFSLFEALLKGFFHTISAITSCGFTACNFSNWIPAIHIILLTLMVCGGCVGSTAGGIKIARIVIIVKEIFNGLINTFRPRMIRNVYFNSRIVEPSQRETVLNFCILSFLLYIFFLFIFALMEPHLDFISAISTVTALFSNSGMAILSSHIDLVNLRSITKVIASLVMVLGRVEFYSVLLLFIPSFWKRY